MISERLKEMRLLSKMTQQELADKIGSTLQAISMYERNKRHPDYDTLKLFSSIFDCTVDYLIGNVNNKNETMDLKENEYNTVIQKAIDSKVTPERLSKLIDFINEERK